MYHLTHRRNLNPFARPDPLPESRLALLEFPYLGLVKRGSSETLSTSSPAKSCGPNDTTGICERPTDSTTTQTLPIVLGAVIPIAIAIIVFIFLHRRHVNRLRSEDANDKHKSLDFGMDIVESSGDRGKKYRKRGVEMTIAEGEKSIRRGNHGLSLDMDVSSPYLLPPGLQGSRESLHSLSRSIPGGDDKYRPATTFTPGDNGSMRSFRSNFRQGQDDSSSHTESSSRWAQGEEMQHNLLCNAQKMSRSMPPVQGNSDVDKSPPPRISPSSGRALNGAGPDRWEHELPMSPPPMAAKDTGWAPRDSSKDVNDFRKSNDYLRSFIRSGTPPTSSVQSEQSPSSLEKPTQTLGESETMGIPEPEQTRPTSLTAPTPQEAAASTVSHYPRISLPSNEDQSDYGDEHQSTNQALLQVNIDDVEYDTQPEVVTTASVNYPYNQTFDAGYEYGSRRLTIGIRPLPPEDPSDNPEQRANRIRSFYKEYFDESKPSQEDYYEDYGPEMFDQDIYYDDYWPDPPFGQPIGRRAMTPPPRMPPYQHQAMSSVSGFGPGPRAFSSASGRFGPSGPSRKPIPPPAPLHELPTPHKLKDDTMVLPIDYAPSSGYKGRRAGIPDGPRAGLRPYSPMLPVHIPLASSYDDLALMPSPHALRKSGTYTALDFAPPIRFRGTDTASDAGSIRSNKTGISAAQAYNIRAGAYRLSRLPTATVGTKTDITSSLRPTWDMHR